MKVRFYYNPKVKDVYEGIPFYTKHYGIDIYMDIAGHGIYVMTLAKRDPKILMERVNKEISLFNETHKKATLHDIKLLITDIFKKR